MNKKRDSKILKFPFGINESERQVEAILFAAEEPLDLKSIEERMKIKANVSKILESLVIQYKNRGINLVCIANKWSFRTASNLSHLMNLQKSNQKKLSKAAIETLSIIVYHQPATRSEIEEIRGVTFASGTLEILLELNWVRPAGRKNVPGKPIQYVTTDEFLSQESRVSCSTEHAGMALAAVHVSGPLFWCAHLEAWFCLDMIACSVEHFAHTHFL